MMYWLVSDVLHARLIYHYTAYALTVKSTTVDYCAAWLQYYFKLIKHHQL